MKNAAIIIKLAAKKPIDTMTTLLGTHMTLTLTYIFIHVNYIQ